MCFNLGVAFGIIHLIATSKYELSKMVQQMETLLQDLKLQKDHSEPSIVGSSADTTIDTTQIEAQQGRRYSLQTDMDLKAKAKDKMDQLEVELDHLQVQLDSEIMANCEYTTEVFFFFSLAGDLQLEYNRSCALSFFVCIFL